MATPQLRSNSAGSEPLTNLPQCWYNKEPTEMASASLDDTERSDQHLLDDAVIMSSPADWADWASQLNDTGPVPSASGGMLSNWDSLDTDYSRAVNVHSKGPPLHTGSFNGSASDLTKGSNRFEECRQSCGAHLGSRGNVSWVIESGRPQGMDNFDPPGTHARQETDFCDMDGSEPSSNQGQIERYPCEPLDDGYHSIPPQKNTSLSPSEERRLFAIAMPGYKQTSDNPSSGTQLPISPISSGVGRASAGPGKTRFPPGIRSARRARKSSHVSAPRKRCRQPTPHNAIEKKYRRNLNSQIDTLRRCVPSLRHSSFPSPPSASCSPPPPPPPPPAPHKSSSSKSPLAAVSLEAAKNSRDGGDDDYGPPGQTHRCTKAIIITRAREHILDQDRAIRCLRIEVADYRARIVAFEALERGSARVRAAYGDL